MKLYLCKATIEIPVGADDEHEAEEFVGDLIDQLKTDIEPEYIGLNKLNWIAEELTNKKQIPKTWRGTNVFNVLNIDLPIESIFDPESMADLTNVGTVRIITKLLDNYPGLDCPIRESKERFRFKIMEDFCKMLGKENPETEEQRAIVPVINKALNQSTKSEILKTLNDLLF